MRWYLQNPLFSKSKPLRKIRQHTPKRILLVKIETALNRIGGNVNQLAAKANSAGFLTKAEVQELKDLIAKAHQWVERLPSMHVKCIGDV